MKKDDKKNVGQEIVDKHVPDLFRVLGEATKTLLNSLFSENNEEEKEEEKDSV